MANKIGKSMRRIIRILQEVGPCGRAIVHHHYQEKDEIDLLAETIGAMNAQTR